MKTSRIIATAALILAAASAGPAWAGRGGSHGGHFGHHHFGHHQFGHLHFGHRPFGHQVFPFRHDHFRFRHRHHLIGGFVGLGVGVPLLVPAVSEPVVVVDPAPAAVVSAPPPVDDVRYYCPSSRSFYPDVPSCDRDWLKVLPDGASY